MDSYESKEELKNAIHLGYLSLDNEYDGIEESQKRHTYARCRSDARRNHRLSTGLDESCDGMGQG